MRANPEAQAMTSIYHSNEQVGEHTDRELD